MAIHTEEISQVQAGGFKKTFDTGSEKMIFDSLQRLQYQYPYKSTVRELASNCIDAISERDIARLILTGKTSVEEHYVKLEGTQYKDSYFDPSYYDLSWLSDDPNVYITYEEGTATSKDRIIIKDNGVGLWGDRLMGYFKLAYSTKRLSRFGLGKFGMGAKAALSTNVPSYTVVNRYNGKEMWFTVYAYQVVPAVPKFAEDGSTNKSFVLTTDDNDNPVHCYYLDTTEKNGIEVQIDSKKHNKPIYADSVRSQLLYFDNVQFKLVQADGRVDKIPVKANIVYEDNIMVLSDNELYNKPHILINRVNYGNIDFRELELEDKMGNISIKMSGEEVSISPNRESVLWDETTRAAVIKRFKEVQVVSENLMQAELAETDFLKWMRNSIAFKLRMTSGGMKTLVGRLSQIVDLTNYTPVYNPDKQFRLDALLFAGMHVRLVFSGTKREGSVTKMVVERKQATFSELLSENYPIVIQTSDTQNKRDKYMLENLFQDGFITIWLNDLDKGSAPEDVSSEEYAAWVRKVAAMRGHALSTATELRWYAPIHDPSFSEQQISKAKEVAMDAVMGRWKALNEYILASDGIQFYENFVVPEDYGKEKEQETADDDTLSTEQDVQGKEAKESAEERRKLSGKTVLFTPRIVSTLAYERAPYQLYDWHKIEPMVADIDQWDNDEVFYSSDDESSLLIMAAAITRPQDAFYDNTIRSRTDEERLENFKVARPVRLVKVAQNRVKYYRDFKHIRNFFGQVKNKVITMSNALIKWNTGRYVHKNMNKLAFLNNFSLFDTEKAVQYQTLVRYCATYYRSIEELTDATKYKAVQKEEYDDMISHLDQVMELQLFVREHAGESEAIAARVREMYGTQADIHDGAALDTNIYDMLQALLEYAEPIQVMFNEMPVLCNKGWLINEGLEGEIRNFIKTKQAGISIQSPNNNEQ